MRVVWFSILACCVSSGCSSLAKKSNPQPVFTPQLGVRIASSAYSFNLLPSSTDGAQPAISVNRERKDLPLSLSQHPPSLVSLGGKMQIENLATKPSSTSEFENTLLAQNSPLSMNELAGFSPNHLSSNSLTDTRFVSQLFSGIYANRSTLWNKEFVDYVGKMNFPSGEHPMNYRFTNIEDPFFQERERGAEMRGEKRMREILRDSAKQSDFGHRIVEEMKDWRDAPINFFLALAGGDLDQETPDGGHLILGPQWSDLKTAANPQEIFRVRYVQGPFEARAQIRQAWVRLREEWNGNRFYLKYSYEYLSEKKKLQASVERSLDEATILRLIGGTGIGMDSLTGLPPFPESHEEKIPLGFMAQIDHRF